MGLQDHFEVPYRFNDHWSDYAYLWRLYIVTLLFFVERLKPYTVEFSIAYLSRNPIISPLFRFSYSPSPTLLPPTTIRRDPPCVSSTSYSYPSVSCFSALSDVLMEYHTFASYNLLQSFPT